MSELGRASTENTEGHRNESAIDDSGEQHVFRDVDAVQSTRILVDVARVRSIRARWGVGIGGRHLRGDRALLAAMFSDIK